MSSPPLLSYVTICLIYFRPDLGDKVELCMSTLPSSSGMWLNTVWLRCSASDDPKYMYTLHLFFALLGEHNADLEQSL